MAYYSYFCKICGTNYTSARFDSLTCSKECRVSLSQLSRKNIITDETKKDLESMNEEEKEKVKELSAEVTSGNLKDKKE